MCEVTPTGHRRGVVALALFLACVLCLPAAAATFTVTLTNDSGAGSLRQAILDANAAPGADEITFNITGSLMIAPASALPLITDPVSIDGATQPGFAGVPIIELNGTNAGAAVDGLKISAGNCVIRSLVINRFPGDGIEISTNGFNTVEGCYIGLHTNGLFDLGNSLFGIVISNSANNVIGGVDTTNRNYIAGNNSAGIHLLGTFSTNNSILGNFIGLNLTNGAVANSVDGIRVNAPANLIGGAVAGARNVISGNTGEGIEVTANGPRTIIRGNYIGTDVTGTIDRGNSTEGILVSATAIVIGGSAAGEGNLISGNNSDGIELTGLSASNNIVLGNIIGASANGMSNLFNTGNGVLISISSRSNIIGGVAAGEGNIIAFNNADGISVAASVANTNHAFRGNSIFSNGDLGIDLGITGVTANDAGDADTGANQLQNFPVLTGVTNTATELFIAGTLNSRANTAYVLDFYANYDGDAAGAGEPKSYLGSTNLTTDGTGITNFLISLPVVDLPGRFVTATATDNFGNTSECSTNIGAVSTVAGMTFIVVNTNAAGPGSLRAAISNANTMITAGDTITFNLPGAGPQTIFPGSALPTVTDPVIIDGYTQSGAASNTLANGFDATLLVRISGAGIAFTIGGNTVRGLVIMNAPADALSFTGGGTNVIEGNLIGLDVDSTDRGAGGDGIHLVSSHANVIGGSVPGARNVISGNSGQAVDISGVGTTGNVIAGNFLGTDLNGTAIRANATGGILIGTGVASTTIGGAAAGERNVVSGNSGAGIQSSGGGTIIQGNYIGTDVNGVLDLGNTLDGITLSSATNSVVTFNLISGNTGDGIEITGSVSTNNVVQNNLIGTTVSGAAALGNNNHGVSITASTRFNQIGGVGAGNTIAFNNADGVNVASGTNNPIRANAIHSNNETGIDLGTTGVTPNDVGDADTGANQLQNFPVLTGVTNGPSGTELHGTLSSATNRTFTLDFFSSVSVDPTGSGEGEIYLGSTNVITGGGGTVDFAITLPVTNLTGRYISATATDTNGNTSEFSPALAAVSTHPGLNLIVVNTNDSGAGSLRQAITAANASITAGDVITFNISGGGIHTISPLSALPTIIDPVVIDGYTQPGSSSNTLANGFNGTLLVRLQGSNAPSGTDALRFTVGHNLVRGLIIVNFAGAGADGLEFSGSGSNLVAGNLIGLDSDNTDRGNGAEGIRLLNSAGNTIGGTAPGDRNVISGNGSDGIELSGITASGNLILGNFIGTDLTGTLDRGNAADGIFGTASPDNTIGGLSSAARNLISGNDGDGVNFTTTGASNNVIVGNYIGTDITGTLDLGNTGAGVFISGVPFTTIGGSNTAARNIISGNNDDGVNLSNAGATGTTVQGNYIGTDVTGTLDLGNNDNGVILSSAPSNVIGGPGSAGNIISGNGGDGIELTGLAASNNIIRGNLIGTGVDGTSDLGNSGNGVLFTTFTHDNTLSGGANVIAFSGGDGVSVSSGTNNVIRHNAIFSNDDLGIDLGTTGPATNDVGDADTGANQLQNFPVLLAATNSALDVVITGVLSSRTNAAYVIDFYASTALDPSGHGEGEVYLGETNVVTDGSGNAAFTATLPVTLTGRYVAATATDGSGNSSEFSRWIPANSTIAPATFVVTNAADSGPGSLREAIDLANSYISGGSDVIEFALPGAGPHTIFITNELPGIVDAVTIDGYSQTGAVENSLCTSNDAVLQVRLSGEFNAGPGTDGLQLEGVGNSIVRGLAIVSFTSDGIEISGGTNHQVAGCFIGIDVDGDSLASNAEKGIRVSGPGTSANRIGGDVPADRNIISGNLEGVYISTSADNVVAGNLIGTDRTGTQDRGNEASGVAVFSSNATNKAPGNVIGGTSVCKRNVISGNGDSTFASHFGIQLQGVTNTLIVGNYIGLDASGTQVLGNGSSGVNLGSSHHNVIGGGTSAERNIISGNGYGVVLETSSTNNSILGNYIGTDVTGTLPRGNTIFGVEFFGAGHNLLQGNVVSANTNDAIYVPGAGSAGNRIYNNIVGSDVSGTLNLRNFGTGIRVEQSDTFIGGTNGEGNFVAFNTSHGVTVSSSAQRVLIAGNSIYSNSNIGIDLLNTSGVTTNDLDDPDAGSNLGQNFPVLIEALVYPTQTVFSATLNSRSNATYRIEFFSNETVDATGFGEGQAYLGFTNVTTDGGGDVAFTFTHPAPLTVGHHVTATAIDGTNNTSEFSRAVRVVPFDSVDLALAKIDSSDPAAHATTAFYTLTITNSGPADATGVVATDTLPAGVAFVSATSSQGSCTHTSGIVTCNLGAIADGSFATVSIEVATLATALVTNSAVVAAVEFDNNLTNNADSESTFFGVSDLAVTIVDSPDPVIAGQPLTNVVTVTNLGPDSATGTVLTFAIDSSAVVTGAAVSQGSFSQLANSFTCNLGAVPPGGSATLTVAAIPTQSGVLGEFAAVSNAEADPVAGNDSVSASAAVLDGPGVFDFSSTVYSVGEGIGLATFTVVRNGGSIGTVTVNYATANGTATAGSDYTSTSGTLTFSNGVTSQAFTVPINDDPFPECNEEFLATLSNPTGGAVVAGTTNATLFIFDNDIAASGQISGASLADTNVIATANSDSFDPVISEDGRYIAFVSPADNLAAGDFNFSDDIFLHDRVTGSNALISVNTGGTSGNGNSFSAAISADGARIAFVSSASDLTPHTMDGSLQAYVRDRVAGTTVLASIDTTGGRGNDQSMGVALSSNGTRVVYVSSSSDLVAFDTNNAYDVFVYDLDSGSNTLVSVNSSGTLPADAGADTSSPMISENGNFVLFLSTSSDIVPGAGPGVGHLYLRDLSNSVTMLVDVDTNGLPSNTGAVSENYFISADGRYVAFDSSDPDLAPGTPATPRHTYRRDMIAGTTVLAGVSDTEATAVSSTFVRGMSRDGRYVLFETTAGNLATNDINGLRDIFVRDLLAGTTTLVSVNQAGDGTGADESIESRLSANGRYVAFKSAATNLVPAAKLGFVYDAFVRDLQAGTTTMLSTRHGGVEGGDGSAFTPAVSTNGVVAFASDAEDLAPSDDNFDLDVFARAPAAPLEVVSKAFGATPSDSTYDPQISLSGNAIVFATYAGNIIPGDTNDNADVFLHNVTNGVVMISLNTNGVPGNNYSDVPDVSADGRYVVFYSQSSDLVAGDTNNTGDIFRRDTVASTTTLISVPQTGAGSANNASFDPDLSPDGRFVVFESRATNLVANDVNGTTYDIFIRDTQTNVVELITRNGAGTGSANNASFDATVSDDGRYVAFESEASDLGPADSNGNFDVYVRDRLTGSNLLCSINTGGTSGGNRDSFTAIISGNGAVVLFSTLASDLVPGDTNSQDDVFAYDVTNRTVQLVSVNTNGVSGNDQSYDVSVSADGRYAVFASDASDLAANDLNGQSDIFLRDLVSGTTILVSRNCEGADAANGGSYFPQISADGRYISFESEATDLTAGDFIGFPYNVFRYDRVTDTTVLVSMNRLLTGGGNNDSYFPRVSGDGQTIGFLSSASDLILNDANGFDDLFVWQASTNTSTVDLVMNKAVSTNTVYELENFSYTLTVTNYGSSGATGVSVADALPAAVSFVSATTSQGTVTNVSGTVTATLGSLGVNAGAQIVITVTAATAGTPTNLATAVAVESDATPANNSDSVGVTILPSTPSTPPTLGIQATNTTQLLITWPNTTSPAYGLETTTNLLPIAIWIPVTNSVSDDGTLYYILLNIDPLEPMRFYRLKQ